MNKLFKITLVMFLSFSVFSFLFESNNASAAARDSILKLPKYATNGYTTHTNSITNSNGAGKVNTKIVTTYKRATTKSKAYVSKVTFTITNNSRYAPYASDYFVVLSDGKVIRGQKGVVVKRGTSKSFTINVNSSKFQGVDAYIVLSAGGINTATVSNGYMMATGV